MEKTKIGQFSASTSTRTALALCVSLLAFSSSAAIIEVPGDYSTIQAAVTAASSGDQVTIHEGTYYENVVIDKPLLLLSDAAHIAVSGEDPAITIASDNVQVSGFDISTTPGGDAIAALEQGGITIDSCNLTGGTIRLEFSKGTVVSNCVSSGAYFGIMTMGNGFYGGVSDVITGCQISTAFCGVEVSYSAVPVTVSSNTIQACDIGIDVGDNYFASLVGNSLSYMNSDSEPFRFYSEFYDCSVELTGNNLSASGYGTYLTALTLLNEGGENSLNVTGHFNRFAASTAVTLSGVGAYTANLTNNWWGKNSAPTSDVSVAPWLTMGISPGTITASSGSVAVSCDWSVNSASQNVSALGTIPDFQNGYFTCTGTGYLVDPLLDNLIPIFVTSGTTSALYYPSASPDTISAIVDYETVQVPVNQ